jgi:hypothetical protein
MNSKKLKIALGDSNVVLEEEGIFIGIEWMGCKIAKEASETGDARKDKCRMACLVYHIPDERILNQTFSRNIFNSDTWIDINDVMIPDLSLIPAFSISIIE